MDVKIIDKVLAKTATPEEARNVAVWFATEEGQKYLSLRYDRESFLMNEKTLTEWLENEIPSNRMKANFLTRLKPRIRTFRFRVVAAVIIPFVLLAGAFFFITARTGIFSESEIASVTVPYGEQLKVLLQDGTVVQLNSGSQLQYPKTFGLFNRKVKLIGEAYFTVAKERHRPFIVNLDEINVKVTGTKFNTKAYPEDSKITVSLEEGSVNITDRNNKVYPLKIGQNADFDKKTGRFSIGNAEDMTQHTAWLTKSLNFYRTPLKEILSTLERQYEVQFIVNDSSLLNYKYSISTSRVNASQILADLEKVSKIKFKKTEENTYEVTSMP